MPIDLAGSISYPGPPTNGTWQVGDFVVDSESQAWYCTVAGTGASSGWTSSSKVWTALTLVSGTAVQTNLTTDSSVFFSFTTTGSATAAIAIGPTSTPANTLWTEAFGTGLTVGKMIDVPAGWYIKVTLVNATMVAGGYLS